MQAETLSDIHKQKKPSRFLGSLIWGVIVFLFLLVGLELLCRWPKFNHFFPERSVGSYHSQFEVKWFKLEDYVKENGGVDVILIGNSMVNTGIDTDILSSRYEELTGQKLRIFNFGVEGLTVAPVSKIAGLLEQKYHPGTIIVYTEMRDYSAKNGLTVENQFMSNDWIKYKEGENNLAGKLIDSSALLQHLLPLRNWSRNDFIDTYFMTLRRTKETTLSGYEADHSTGEDIQKVPDPNDPAEKSNFELFSNFSMDSGRIQDLLSIIGFQQSGTKVLVTEFPVYPTYYAYFGSDQVVEQYHQQIQQVVENAGSTFIPAVDYSLIPLEDRMDNHHLNFKGAPLYSEILAENLASLCNTQQNCLAPSSPMEVQP